MESVKPCSVEDFKSLKTKAYRNIPRALLKTLIKEVPDYALVVYLALYDLAELNIRYPGTVHISHRALSREVGKSEPSVRRAIDALKKLGYLELKQPNQQHRWMPNIIRVCCPDSLAQRIKKNEPDRANTASVKRISTINRAERTVNHNPLKFNKTTEILYEGYQKIVKQFIDAGKSPLTASQHAYKTFSKEEAACLQQFILGLSPLPKMTEGCSKMSTIRSSNNRDQDLLLTIGEQTPVDKRQEFPNTTITTRLPVVDFKKSASVVHLLSESDKSTVIRKIKAMAIHHEIHATLQARYGGNLPQLISEVIFHIQHRDEQNFKTFQHALNACAKMLRQGVWSTPKRLVQQFSMQREQKALLTKQQICLGALKLSQIVSQGLGFRRVNM